MATRPRLPSVARRIEAPESSRRLDHPGMRWPGVRPVSGGPVRSDHAHYRDARLHLSTKTSSLAANHPCPEYPFKRTVLLPMSGICPGFGFPPDGKIDELFTESTRSG